MAKWKRGDLVELNGLLAVVVGVDGDPNVPEEHVALWYGAENSSAQPVAWTVPEEYLVPAPALIYKH